MRRWLGTLVAVAALLGACSVERLSVEEFCDLARQIDIETTALVQIPQNTEEFELQQRLVRNLTDQMFDQAPEEIADVADELGPMLTAPDADNDRVVQLLDVFTTYRARNCSGGNTR